MQLKEEKGERMKMMKEYANMQEKLRDGDKERSELLFTLTDLKSEARSILQSYEEASQCIPELKVLLQKSAQQKEEFSGHIKTLQVEANEYRKLIGELCNDVNQYKELKEKVELENEQLKKTLDELQTKYNASEEELCTTNQQFLDIKQSYKNLEENREGIKEKALNTLKLYHLKCQSYEQEIIKNAEEYEFQRKELSKVHAEVKELEITDIKQKFELVESSNKVEELQNNLTEYTNECHKLSNEKDELQSIVSQLNDCMKEYQTILDEKDQLKNDNIVLRSELLGEKQERLDFENVRNSHSESHLLLKSENSDLQQVVAVLRNILEATQKGHEQEILKISEKYKTSAQDELQLLNEKNGELLKRLQVSEDNSEEVKKQNEAIQEALDKQKILTEKEIEKSQVLIQTWRAVTMKNEKIRDDFLKEKQRLKEKLKSMKSSGFTNQEQYAILQTQVNKIQKENVKDNHNFKNIIDIITNDVEHLQNVLWYEEDYMNPPQQLPENVITNHEIEVTELREKIISCFSITKALKERYNNQKLLITRARERILSQLGLIKQLKISQNDMNVKYDVPVAARVGNENSSLQNYIDNVTDDSAGLTKEHYTNILLVDGCETLQRTEPRHTDSRMMNEIEKHSFAISEVLINNVCEQRPEIIERNMYTDCMVETCESCPPDLRRLGSNNSSYYESCNSCAVST